MTGKEYVLSVLEQEENRNSNEKEFLDAGTFTAREFCRRRKFR